MTNPAGRFQTAARTPEYRATDDERLLHRLGYAQELSRAMGGFRNFAISFTIISFVSFWRSSFGTIRNR